MPTKVTKSSQVIKSEVSVPVQNNVEEKKVQITGESLISFISGAQTNIGRETFYNLKEEQRQAMVNQHLPILEKARPFYSLMMLPSSINDANRQMIAWNLIEKTIRESDLKPNEHSPITKWENELILQTLDNMPVTRVFDFFTQFQEKRITKKRAFFLMHEYLRRHKNSWDLWTIKYRKHFVRILRHAHISFNSNKKNHDPYLAKLWRYLKYQEKEGCGQLIQDYEDVRNGDQSKLSKLPESVAEGFMTKFKLKKEDFLKNYIKDGGKLTVKEKRLKVTSAKEAGVNTGFDIRKAKLFDLLVYLKSLDRLPESEERIKDLLKKKAGEIANKLSFELEKVGLIFDTSLSMQGTKEQPFHPMFKGMALSLIFEHISKGFKEYRTNPSSTIFPILGNQSNYADSVLQALKDGCETIIIVGDGYENSPFEGALHALLYAYKNKIDKKNKLVILHFNPVFASESMDVRSISNLASYIGIRDVEALNESMFLVIAKQKPLLAIKKYIGYLANLQNEKAKQLMPIQVQKMISGKEPILLE